MKFSALVCALAATSAAAFAPSVNEVRIILFDVKLSFIVTT